MTTRQEIFEVIKGNIKEILENVKDEDITEEQTLKNLGADSLEIVEIVSRSMKQLKIKVSRTELAQLKNLGELVSLFEKYKDQG